jgi:hypothetical protein
MPPASWQSSGRGVSRQSPFISTRSAGPLSPQMGACAGLLCHVVDNNLILRTIGMAVEYALHHFRAMAGVSMAACRR